MKKLLLSILALVVLGSSPLRVEAQEAGAKPIAVVAIKGYDDLMSDVAFLGKISGNPDIAQTIEGTLMAFTQGQGLAGLDKTRPWGLTISAAADGSFQPLAFLPVTDLKKLLTSLSAIIGEAEAEGALMKITPPSGAQMFLKQQGGWAFIGQTAEALKVLPKDPSVLTDALTKRYDIAVRAYVRNIPAEYREMAIAQLQQQVERGLKQEPGEDETNYELRKKVVENQIKSMTGMINESDTVTVGWTIDSTAQTTFLDFSLTAVAGSALAKKMALMADVKSSFAGFLVPTAAATLNITSRMSADDIESTVSVVDTLRAKAMTEIENDEKLPDEASKKAVKDVLNEFIEVIQATIETGRLDGAAALLLEEKDAKLVAGAYVSDGAAFESALKKLVALAENEPDFPGMKFNVETYNSVRFHSMEVPVPENEEEARKIFGETLEVYVGVGPKAVYLAAGTDSLAAVKAAIDKSAAGTAKGLRPFRLSVGLGAILKFASAMEENPMVAMMAAELEKSAGKDHVHLLAQPITDGVIYRLQAEEGVLKLLGQAGQLAAGQSGL